MNLVFMIEIELEFSLCNNLINPSFLCYENFQILETIFKIL